MPDERLQFMDFWKLERPPFEADNDPVFFFESHAHGEALARMNYLVGDRGMVIGALTGEIGAGKTMLLNVLRSRLPSDRYRIAHLTTAAYPMERVLQEINRQLGGRDDPAVPPDRYAVTREFEHVLNNKVAALGRHLLIILDEAQFLDPECLDGLKCLTNLNPPGKQTLTLLLAGQPELKARLKELPQVYQRIGMFYHLGLLQQEEVPRYVRHRLHVAGASHLDMFEDGCMNLLYDFSGGCPRQINKVCKLVLDRAGLLKKARIERDMLQVIIDDIRRHFD